MNIEYFQVLCHPSKVSPIAGKVVMVDVIVDCYHHHDQVQCSDTVPDCNSGHVCRNGPQWILYYSL